MNVKLLYLQYKIWVPLISKGTHIYNNIKLIKEGNYMFDLGIINGKIIGIDSIRNANIYIKMRKLLLLMKKY